MATSNNKTALAGLLALALALCLSGCSGQTTQPESSVAPSPAPIEILGKAYSPDSKYVDLNKFRPEDTEAVVEALPCLNKLEKIDLGFDSEFYLPVSILTRIHDSCPGAVINYDFKLYDKTFNLSDETLDLKNVPINDGGQLVRQVISLMNNLSYLDMEGCGLSNEEMDAIRQDYPKVKVVWRINFGDHYTVRTDVESILASLPGQGGELLKENTEDLKYCIYVKYLDLGHNNYLDTLEFIRYMPELEVGIFAMSNIEDFSPLADCPKLEYLELETSRLHDLTPLSGLKDLRHLNICFNFAVNDISPLYSLTELERLWIGCHDPVSEKQVAEMQKAAPNCIINTTTDDPTAQGWRMFGADAAGNATYHERYALLREQFGYQEGNYPLDHPWGGVDASLLD